MRILIAEDDFASRLFMKKFLSKYGDCDVAVDGIEAIDAYLNSIQEGQVYDLICLDIMMPKVYGLHIWHWHVWKCRRNRMVPTTDKKQRDQ